MESGFGYYSSNLQDVLRMPYSESANSALKATSLLAIADELHEMNNKLQYIINKSEIKNNKDEKLKRMRTKLKRYKEVTNEQQRKERETATQQNELL